MTDTPKNSEQPNDAEETLIKASFQQFLSGMGAQTLMQLGKMTNPLTNRCEVDLVNARYSIDLLGILQEKTKGNLTEDEDHYFRAMLTNLRMVFVQATEQSVESLRKDTGKKAAAPDSKTETN